MLFVEQISKYLKGKPVRKAGAQSHGAKKKTFFKLAGLQDLVRYSRCKAQPRTGWVFLFAGTTSNDVIPAGSASS